MRLGGLFPASRGLADTVKKAAPIKAAASSLVTAIVNTVKKKPGEFDIKWPKMRTQKVKDYQAITTVAELKAYIAKCKETGLGAFDYETGPKPHIREKYESRIKSMIDEQQELRDQLDALEVTAKREYDAVEDAYKPPAMEDIAVKLSKDRKRLNAAIKTIDAKIKALIYEYRRTPLDPHKAEICALSLAAGPDEARAIFISNKPGKRTFEPAMNREEARTLIFNILEEELFHSPDTRKIAVNLQFEAAHTAALGKYILPPVADPFIMWIRCLQVVAPQKIEEPKRPYTGKGLKPMTKEYYGVEMQDFNALLDELGANFFSDIPADHPKALSYCCEDSDYAIQHYLYWLEIAQQIPGYEDWLLNIECPFARVIGLMEYNGMAWDNNLANVKQQEAEIMQETASEEIKRIVKESTGIDINPGKTGKTNEVKSILFDTMNLKAAKWSETTGGPSLDEEALIDMKFMLENKLEDIKEEKYLAVPLPDGWEYMDVEANELNLFGEAKAREYEDIAGQIEDLQRLQSIPAAIRNLSKDERMAIRIAQRTSHPYKDAALALIGQMDKIQKYTTLLSAHIVGRAQYLHEETGRIHANYSQWTETSRLNSFQPNGQNVPAMHNDVFKIRNFYVPAVGKIMFFIDFSGFELRIMAWKSGDEAMIEIFNTGGDIHRRTASAITGKPAAEVTDDERSDAKPANFGIAYGGTEHALQKTVKTDYGKRWTLDFCASIINSVKTAYKRIPEYQRDIVLEAREKGWVSTLYGYIRLLPNINSPNKYARGSDERRAGNTPIQGTAADVMKKCQNAVYDETGRGTLARRISPDAEIILAHGVTDMCAQIHDEIIFEMDDDINVVEKAGSWVKALMEQPPIPGFPVKIEAEASVGYRWGEKEKLQKWISKKTA